MLRDRCVRDGNTPEPLTLNRATHVNNVMRCVILQHTPAPPTPLDKAGLWRGAPYPSHPMNQTSRPHTPWTQFPAHMHALPPPLSLRHAAPILRP